MNNIGNDIKELIRAKALESGFGTCGFARAERVSDDAIAQYENWLADGKNDCMEYAEKYAEVRNDPRELLPGAKTVICVALNYYPATRQAGDTPQFALYSYGNDYHDVVRDRLKLLARYIEENWHAQSRICVDTAPIREKYWARQAGIGMIGRNNLLIIPGKGSFFFLGELVTTLELPPDAPCTLTCGDCRECEKACPGGALHDGKAVDARRCLSCQLIEHRGDLPQWVNEKMGNRLYGCDECQLCCPHNRNATPTDIPEFAPNQRQLSLSSDDISAMTDDQFREIFRKSAVKRAKLAGLQRNARVLAKEYKK